MRIPEQQPPKYLPRFTKKSIHFKIIKSGFDAEIQMFTPVTAHTAWTNYSMFTFSIVMTYLGCIGLKKKEKESYCDSRCTSADSRIANAPAITVLHELVIPPSL